MERNLCLLILLCLNLYGADFIYSAQISTTNHITTYQNISISPAMQKQSFKYQYLICTLDKDINNTLSEYDFLLLHEDQLFDCFESQNAKVYEDSIFKIRQLSTKTQLFILPLYFKAEFLENKVNIYLLKASY